MTEAPERPNPDALLEKIEAATSHARRARLRIFFGFAPGVGKTYRMLTVARELERQGRDVVVGVVETHGRVETAKLADGLERVPLRRIEHRGRVLEEMDLDAALARRPSVILVDELAHTNAPGSRHPKRWQDVLDLLDRGIDVLSTINVQHIESLNDVVAQITQVRVRETVPDRVLDRADEIELVDIAPEELLLRLKEGKVYLPDQAARAAGHFFRRGNLLALRELALRRTAEHVDADVVAYRRREGVQATWPAGERILVCVGPSPASLQLVRAARRMAAGLRAPWVAAYVDLVGVAPSRDEDRRRLETHLSLAESLGATVVRLTGSRVGAAILEHARKHNVTRIIIGKPTHSPLRDRLRGSLLDDVVRGSGDIDVHVISGDAGQEDGRARTERPAAPPLALLPYVSASALVALTTLVSVGLRRALGLPDLEVLYLLAIMVTAIRYGRWPALAAAALAVAAYDFFLVPPHYTFAVADGRYVLTFAMMFAVGWVLSALAVRIKNQERDAIAREKRTRALFALTRDLASAEDDRVAARVLVRHTRDAFEPTEIVVWGRDGAGEPLATFPDDLAAGTADRAIATWTLEHGRPAGLGSETLPAAHAYCVPIRATSNAEGALSIVPADGQALGVEQRELLDAFSKQAGLAFERARLSEEARVAALRAKTEEMRSSLLSTVSHDLRTPLGAITGAATTLRSERSRLAEDATTGLLDAIIDEAARLERLVGNLLDMTRLESGDLPVKREWVPADELVGAALTRLEAALAGRPVTVAVPDATILVAVDPVLVQQVFVNLLENAAKYTPDGSPLEIAVHASERQVVFDFLDRGLGLSLATRKSIFEKFERGEPPPGVGGAGLGLAICKGIVEAHGGTLGVRSREGGGTVFTVTLPIVGEPPSMNEEEA